jgi:hypothetical protein
MSLIIFNDVFGSVKDIIQFYTAKQSKYNETAMTNTKIRSADTKLIAEALECSTEQVRAVLKGKAGKRPTILQVKILHVAKLRMQQDDDLIEYCHGLTPESLIED